MRHVARTRARLPSDQAYRILLLHVVPRRLQESSDPLWQRCGATVADVAFKSSPESGRPRFTAPLPDAG